MIFGSILLVQHALQLQTFIKKNLYLTILTQLELFVFCNCMQSQVKSEEIDHCVEQLLWIFSAQETRSPQ